MAVNVKGGQANVVIARQTVSFISAGINSSNVTNIFLIDAVLKSFNPSRTINPITMFEAGKGYYINALQDMDLEAYVGPPFPSGGNGIITEDGDDIIPET
ncbi:MAG: hypothetical protein ACTHLE_04160 [Agriterribacter sp.]